MRTSDEIKKLILDIAANDARIRAVVLTGSRADPEIPPDKYQDFDVIFVVDDLSSFISDHSWINIFGRRLICQFPDEMFETVNDKKEGQFHYLMLLEDGNRIDLTLLAVDRVRQGFQFEAARMNWLDKDNLLAATMALNDPDHLIKRPGEKQFLDTCNEFWWVSTNVARGLARGEITYSKQMLETYVRPMFMKMIEWQVGVTTGFSASFGKGGRFMKNYLPLTVYEKILKTYSDHQSENNWHALFIMTKLFGALASSVAASLGFQYEIAAEKNATIYLEQLHRART